jgi:predicted DCC family thiol-disulfide oxidoreductase YuxK
MNKTSQPVILYDGVCGLCDRFVQFIITHDPSAKIKLAPLQSESAIALLQKFHLPITAFSTVVLIEEEKSYIKSAAVLRSLNYLDGAWKFFTILKIIPTPLSDFMYDFVARYRYRWFGKFDACIIPSPEIKSRFLP